jgi:hypothetical protein
MSYETMREEVLILDAAIQERFEQGDPLKMIAHDARPELLIRSFSPLAYESFGSLRNRAPRLTGSIALRSLLIAPGSVSARVFFGAQTERDGYGFNVGAKQVNDIAEQLGRPRTFFNAG